jgi:hypothetical protein
MLRTSLRGRVWFFNTTVQSVSSSPFVQSHDTRNIYEARWNCVRNALHRYLIIPGVLDMSSIVGFFARRDIHFGYTSPTNV